MPEPPPIALTIAGSDSSAGAGLQADLKTFAAHGVYGLCAATAVVAEIPGNVAGWESVSPTLLMRQMETVVSGFAIRAAKTGMLGTPENVSIVCDFLESHPDLPVVVDPVMVATSGDSLLDETAIALYRDRLLPRAALATPNLAEAAALLGEEIQGVEAMEASARRFSDSFGCPVLIKGGHLPDSMAAVDFLCESGGVVTRYESERIPGADTHGTGCTLSAAITAGLARGLSLSDAVKSAKIYITEALRQAHSWGTAARITALNHFPEGVTS